jgi:RNA polymerase sigma-70 factor (ECF subfamily)
MDADSAPTPIECAEDLYRRYHADLVRMLMYAGATAEDADDAIIDGILPMCRRWPEPNHPQAYARKAVLHAYLKLRMQAQRQLDLLEQLWALQPARTPAEPSVWEDREWIRQLLMTLPRRQREVLACVIDGLQPHEIAILLGRSPAAVRQNLRAARIRIRKALEAQRPQSVVSSPDKEA